MSASELIRQQQAILTRNGENQRKRDNLGQINQTVERLTAQIAELQVQLERALTEQVIAMKSAENLQDESTVELEQNISNVEEINRKVRANLDKDKADEDALIYKNQYDTLTEDINNIRQSKLDLLQNTELPLPNLTVQDGELLYRGQKWDNMSGSDHLKVATAIVRKLNPKCGFVLLDKLEQMDIDTLNEFGKWLESEGLQAIATRVSTGDECSILIEDGYVTGQNLNSLEPDKKSEWKAGEF